MAFLPQYSVALKSKLESDKGGFKTELHHLLYDLGQVISLSLSTILKVSIITFIL